MLARIDTPEGAKRLSEYQPLYPSGPPRACGEQWIEKLVVEKLEIQDSGSTNGNGNWQSLQTKSSHKELKSETVKTTLDSITDALAPSMHLASC